MHEMSIAQSLLRIVEQTMRQNQVSQLRRVKLIAGRMNALVPHALQTAFDLLTRETPLQGAELLIESTPVALQCSACSRTFTPEGEEPTLLFLARCPHCCAESGHRLTSGRELYLEYIEAE